MFSLKNMPSTNSIFSTYASVAASAMLVRSAANEFIPSQLQNYVLSGLSYFFHPSSSYLTLVIEEFDGFVKNEAYEASEIFLSTKITPEVQRLRVTKAPREKNVWIAIEKGQELNDEFEGIQLRWKSVCAETQKSNPDDPYSVPMKTQQRSFELRFHKKHKNKVVSEYLPHVLNRAKAVKEEKKDVRLFTLGSFYGESSGGGVWGSINLEHPSNFDTLAMDPELKKELIEDLDRFVRRREFYKKVGKAWKRGYLLYGPPGTGKSSLIAAMANYLKFDIYDLELPNLQCDSELRRLLVATANRSILVIEDIDCTADLENKDPGYPARSTRMTLSGLLNFVDGLWSSCGDERIIVFTTNHKDRLDPALLRPGRMDVHIHMSYCTVQGFKLLASNYLGIKGNHKHFAEIEELMEKAQVTPAEVAEELMKSDDIDASLCGLVKFLKRKKLEAEPKDETKEEEEEEPKKKQKIDIENDNGVEIARTGARLHLRGRRGGKVRCIRGGKRYWLR